MQAGRQEPLRAAVVLVSLVLLLLVVLAVLVVLDQVRFSRSGAGEAYPDSCAAS